MESESPEFLGVERLLEKSKPGGSAGWVWYGAGGLVLLGLLGGIGGTKPTQEELVVQVASAGMMMLIVIGMGTAIWVKLQRFREEQRRLGEVDEFIQLRRWVEAGLALEVMLSRPMRSPTHRVQGLVYLASVLGRYQRFTDALAVQEYLLKHVQFDRAGEFTLKVGRAMAMLREDHLVDADRAMSELRKLSGGQASGGLALVEIYRDIKTGHAAEAIEIFNKRSVVIREQLGHRAGDVHALVARAQDMAGDEAAAQKAWGDATVLTPARELVRRYPEVAGVAEKYVAAVMPGGMSE
ncbi:MAG TPA: hypothetical protein VFE58_13265 [Tepidisphaeraceae bacterium]|jgi:hypothetical protein|nr:hypothetical protein [Tepidisphaeraceae bacterium]